LSAESSKVIFHVDMDAFFASIEQRDNPLLRGKPVVVGAQPGARGVVSAASYEAREYGIHSAMPINQAYARCPHAAWIRPRGNVYSAESHRLMKIFESFSPIVEQISVDEAFLDMTGCLKLWGTPYEAAQKIGCHIRKELSLTGSVGVAPNKFLAKLASDCQKPNGITITPFAPQAIIQWLAPMPVNRIWGVGAHMRQALAGWGIRTIGDLQHFGATELEKRFGKYGQDLYRLCRGIDNREVGSRGEAKSVSREYTFDRDCGDHVTLKSTLLSLARDVAQRCRRKGLKGSTVVFSYRTPDFRRFSRRVTLPAPTNLARDVYRHATALFEKEAKNIKSFRLIGVGLTNFGESIQTSLFEEGTERNQAWRASENAMDQIAQRFGSEVIFLAGERRQPRKNK
jgi:DNA polymerase IV